MMATNVSNHRLKAAMSDFVRFSHSFLKALWKIQGICYGLLTWLMLNAVAITYLEKIPFSDGLYFTLITGLTIGYGDISPLTPGGRMISVLTGLLGILVTGLIVAIAVYALKETMKPRNDSE
jgi:voltage-gated potassium channel